MILGAVADDFTGASDLANTLARGGMKTVQFTGPGSFVDCDAGVVALKTRSVPVAEAVERSLEAAGWLRDQGCRQILFKYCSTFDSTPQGNIGPVAEALLDLTGAEVVLVCPAFPRTGRRLYRGHLFVGERLLSESGMQHHPLTPMTDPDLRRWLRLQTVGEVGHLPLETVRSGHDAIQAHLAEQRTAGRRLVVADAIEDSDLIALGAAAADHPLITGGSGIALGLPENFRRLGLLDDKAEDLPRPRGPGVILSGSCSAATQAQVGAYAGQAPSLAVDPEAVLAGTLTVTAAVDWAMRHGPDVAPMIYSTANPEAVAAAQARFGRERSAAALEGFFGDVARNLLEKGVRRIVVGGGETSGAVVEALGLGALQVGAEITPGVPALFAERDGPVGLALKSGNFGGPDFFARALDAVGEA